MTPELAATITGTLGGGAMGAAVKILMSLVQARVDAKREQAAGQVQVRLAELGRQNEAREQILQSDAGGGFSAWTRRMLALSICWTFCAIAIVWAIFPTTIVSIPNTSEGWSMSLLGLIDFQGRGDMGGLSVSTGSIVWAMLPFMSMILATYFTPTLNR
jgi:hypothetical protein